MTDGLFQNLDSLFNDISLFIYTNAQRYEVNTTVDQVTLVQVIKDLINLMLSDQ